MRDRVGELIRGWRREIALSPTELADRAGVHRATVYRVEGGGSASAETRRLLAAALGLGMADRVRLLEAR